MRCFGLRVSRRGDGVTDRLELEAGRFLLVSGDPRLFENRIAWRRLSPGVVILLRPALPHATAVSGIRIEAGHGVVTIEIPHLRLTRATPDLIAHLCDRQTAPFRHRLRGRRWVLWIGHRPHPTSDPGEAAHAVALTQ